MKKNERILIASIAALGATCLGSQILILRELLKIFYGNELYIAVILGSWLFLISVGSLVFGRLADRIKNDIKCFSFLLIALSAVIPASIFLCRSIKPLFGLNPGEIVGLTIALYSSLAAICAFCVPYGFLFALGCKIYARLSGDGAKGTGKIFSFEAAGGIAGGIAVSLILLNRLTPCHIAFLFALLNLVFAFTLLYIFRPKKTKFAAYISLILILSIVIAWATGAIKKINDFSERLSWRPFHLLKSEDSIYGNISALSEGPQISFYSNGLFLFSFPDELTAEETIHYALLSHPNAKNVLLVGGGINGALNELYKYNLSSIDYVELDPLLIKMAEEVMGEKTRQDLSNSVLRVIKGDGRFYVKTSKKTYDIIIITAPDPCTIQINRLYTAEFFKEAKKRLRKNGLLSITCEASENYIGPEMAEYLGSVYRTLKEAGFVIRIVPGETIRFLAFNGKNDIPEIDAEFFRRALEKKGIKTLFVRDYYLNSELSGERCAYAKEMITGVKHSSINTDFKPISYYYDIMLWAAYFQSGLKRVLGFLNEKRVWYLILFVYGLILLFYSQKEKHRDKAVFIAIGTTGFAEMAIEINIMLAFQVIYGYLYYRLGFIITSFMAGLFVGAYTITKRLHLIKSPLAALKKSKIALGVISFLLIPIFKILSIQTTQWPLRIGANLIFPLLMFLTGIVGGFQFPIANKIILAKKTEVGKIAGSLYGTDVIGGMLGAILVATILVPLIGIFQCLAAVGFLSVISGIIIARDAA